MNNINRGKFGKQAGVTLLELVMVVGIIAVIMVSGIAYFNSANSANKINDEVKNIASISASVRNMFNTQGHYKGLGTSGLTGNQIVLKSSAFPQRMRVSGSSNIRHSWADDGVEIHEYADSGHPSPHYFFEIVYKDIPEEACADLVSKTLQHYAEVRVGSTKITSLGSMSSSCVGEVDVTWVSS